MKRFLFVAFVVAFAAIIAAPSYGQYCAPKCKNNPSLPGCENCK
jgi:hypothetical protein